MSEVSNKPWTAKRKTSLVMSILKGQISTSSAAREHNLTISEIESWIEELTSAYGEAMLENKALKKLHALLNEDESSYELTCLHGSTHPVMAQT